MGAVPFCESIIQEFSKSYTFTPTIRKSYLIPTPILTPQSPFSATLHPRNIKTRVVLFHFVFLFLTNEYGEGSDNELLHFAVFDVRTYKARDQTEVIHP